MGSLRTGDSGATTFFVVARPELLALLPGLPPDFAARRAEVVAGLAPGERFPILEQTLARFGLGVEERREIRLFATKAGTSGRIDPGTAPEGIRDGVLGLGPEHLAAGQAQGVRVEVRGE